MINPLKTSVLEYFKILRVKNKKVVVARQPVRWRHRNLDQWHQLTNLYDICKFEPKVFFHPKFIFVAIATQLPLATKF